MIRGLAKAGVAAAGGMRVSNPSVTWPNHTTLMTGVHPERHGVLFNGLLERPGEGKPVRVDPGEDQQRAGPGPAPVRHPEGGGTDLGGDQLALHPGLDTIDDNFPDVPDQLRYTTPRLKEELTEAGAPAAVRAAAAASSATRSGPRPPAR